jgi:hypothetical protein
VIVHQFVLRVTATKSVDQAGPTWTLAHFTGPSAFLAASEVNTGVWLRVGTEIKILPKKRPTFASAPVVGKADQALDP